jgi:hypothetical protein
MTMSCLGQPAYLGIMSLHVCIYCIFEPWIHRARQAYRLIAVPYMGTLGTISKKMATWMVSENIIKFLLGPSNFYTLDSLVKHLNRWFLTWIVLNKQSGFVWHAHTWLQLAWMTSPIKLFQQGFLPSSAVKLIRRLIRISRILASLGLSTAAVRDKCLIYHFIKQLQQQCTHCDLPKNV